MARTKRAAKKQRRGGFRHLQLGMIVATDPEAAAGQIRLAWGSMKSATGAAALLEISPATFWRYVDRLTEAGYEPHPLDAAGEAPKRGGRLGPRPKKSAHAR
jgi:hypothetical protein